jgi:hypothetical protein
MPSSTEFDAACYLARYYDVRTSDKWKHNPYGHYQENGRNEGRAPGCDLPGTYYSPVFDGKAYLARYPDIRQSSTWRNNPLGHYQKNGYLENRIPGVEIITPSSPLGFTTPGTTVFEQDLPADTNKEPGDGEIIIPPTEGQESAPTDIDTTETPGPGVIEWAKSNPMEAAAVGAVVLIVIYELSKNKKRR